MSARELNAAVIATLAEHGQVEAIHFAPDERALLIELDAKNVLLRRY
jgi:hypothetical protein